MNDKDLQIIEKTIGYEFLDKRILDAAFTHVSYANEFQATSYERLEYLGDAVVGFVVAEKLYFTFPDLDEGALTKLRKGIVSNEAECSCFKRYDLSRFMRFGGNIRNDRLQENESVISDLFEAVVGAMLADGCEMGFIKDFILRVLDEALRGSICGKSGNDYKSELLELCAKRGSKLQFVLEAQEGPAHLPSFVVAAYIDGKRCASASGHSKREAEKSVAKAVLKAILT